MVENVFVWGVGGGYCYSLDQTNLARISLFLNYLKIHLLFLKNDFFELFILNHMIYDIKALVILSHS